MENKLHEGRNVKRIREFFGIKQKALAYELGEGCNQKKVSMMEQKEVLEPEIIEALSGIFNIPSEAIKTFDDKLAIKIFTNKYESNDVWSFNPLESILKLHNEKTEVLERILSEKDEMIRRIEKLFPHVTVTTTEISP